MPALPDFRPTAVFGFSPMFFAEPEFEWWFRMDLIMPLELKDFVD